MDKFNKKGAFGLVSWIIILVVVGVFITAFTLSGKVRYITIGIVLIAASMFVLIPSVQDRKFKGTRIGLFSLLLAGGLIMIFYLAVQQSVLSVSSVSVQDGKVYWVFQGAADNIGESAVTFSQKPSNYTLSNGDVVAPQTPISLTFSKGDAYCKYAVTKTSRKYLIFFNYEYYILNNPDRVINVNVKDGNGKTITLDGTESSQGTFTNSNGGSATIQTVGAFQGKNDCPNYNNVAITSNSNSFNIVNRNDLENYISSIKLNIDISSALSANKIRQSTDFISGFSSTPSFDGQFVKGNLANLGNAVFTITADQNYFNSVVYTPPVEIKPKITSIDIPSNVQQDSSSSVKVGIKNNQANSQGSMTVTATGSGIGISPGSQTAALKDSTDVYFNAKAQNSVGSYSVTITACSQNQFAQNNCDTKTQTGNIVANQPATYCGDKICQSNENSNTCATDCFVVKDNQNLTTTTTSCKFYESPYTAQSNDYGFLYYKAWFPGANPTVVTTTGCKTSGWVYIVITIAFISVLIFIIFVKFKPKRRRR